MHRFSLTPSRLRLCSRFGTQSFPENLGVKVQILRQIILLISVRLWFLEGKTVSIGTLTSQCPPALQIWIYRIWKSGQTGRSLWTKDGEQPSKSRTQDPFLQSLSFLHTYDLKLVGGVDRILQTAADLAQRRQMQPVAVPSSPFSLKSRFNFWGSASASSSQGISPLVDPPRENGLASQITNSLWRGITNQTAMEDELPSPSDSESPVEVQSPGPTLEDTGPSSHALPSANIWGYAEKIKDSDALATLSKVSTNWRAKGFLGWRSTPNSPTVQHSNNVPGQESTSRHSARLSGTPELLSPPSKFRNVAHSPPSTGSLVDKTRSLFSPPISTPRSGPKPLLLNSTRLTYSPSPRSSAESPYTDTHERDEWAEVMNLKRHHIHRESQSSASSLSPSDALRNSLKSARSDWESDTTTSRIVPLNRRAVSPMAPHYRQPSSRASSASSDINSPPARIKSPLHEISSLDTLVKGNASSFSETEPESSDATSYQVNVASRKLSVKNSNVEETTRAAAPSRSSRVRTRRHPRPANLQIPDVLQAEVPSEPKSSGSSKNLQVEWPTDNQDTVTTPKAGNFESEGHPSSIPSGIVRSPRRSTRKISAENVKEERPRKVSTRSRKVSSDNRETTKIRRTSAEDGDDEGYDELLSAYESEDMNHLGLGIRR